MSSKTNNAVAAAGVSTVKRYTEAKLLLWESGYWVAGAERRARREAKKLATRAVRRSKRAHVRAQSNDE